VKRPSARAFYEIEAARENWNTRELERRPLPFFGAAGWLSCFGTAVSTAETMASKAAYDRLPVLAAKGSAEGTQPWARGDPPREQLTIFACCPLAIADVSRAG
jgi:hypothetical protein